jgi:hypothetical protein
MSHCRLTVIENPEPDAWSAEEQALSEAARKHFPSLRAVYVLDNAANGGRGPSRFVRVIVDFAWWHLRKFNAAKPLIRADCSVIAGPEANVEVHALSAVLKAKRAGKML